MLTYFDLCYSFLELIVKSDYVHLCLISRMLNPVMQLTSQNQGDNHVLNHIQYFYMFYFPDKPDCPDQE